MSRSKRLEPVKQLAREDADQAAKEYAKRHRQLEEQQQRLAQLETFRREYHDRRISSGESGIDAFRLRDYNAFMSRIDAAIAQQRQAVALGEQEAERFRSRWLDVLGRAQALGKVVERARGEEARHAERQAQRLSDDLAQLRHRPPQARNDD